ncbi:uracil catabolism 4 [Fusarium pseudocircinatum]|uniref:Uracil catabolism 4 n=1 Tax=Fusarium pseudocircinatum TaxID=56676 RepID=A0A8H5PSN2_9HYPO|nr:uracil catabolism 4 [Fusarium pseudocircinatum]
MSKQRDPTPQGLDPFGRLPIELNVKIMLLLGIDELFSLTRASPTVWQHFRADHAIILRSHLRQIYNHYGHPAAIPLLILFIRLRKLREKLRGKPRAEIENKLDPILASVLFKDCMEMPAQWESHLPILVAARDLIPELCNTFEIRSKYSWQRGLSLMELLPYHTWVFVESFLRYECFCNISYASEGFLFQNMFDFKHIFLKPFLVRTNFSPSELRAWGQDERMVKPYDMTFNEWCQWSWSPTNHFRFDAPDFYIQQSRWILQRLRESLLSKSPRSTKSGKRLLNILMIQGTGYQHFCYHLSLQGNALLTHLESLKRPGELESYIIAEHTSFLSSQPRRDSIYPSDLEDIEFMNTGWECA